MAGSSGSDVFRGEGRAPRLYEAGELSSIRRLDDVSNFKFLVDCVRVEKLECF